MITDKATHTQTKARLFIGTDLPQTARQQIKQKLVGYTRYTRKTTPAANWHITFLFIGTVTNYQQYLPAICESMPQTFLPTITLTHLGRGLQKQQLWAFIQPTPLLTNLKAQLLAKAAPLRKNNPPARPQQDFIPHVKLADLRRGQTNTLLVDIPLSVVWRLEHLNIYHCQKSVQGIRYSLLGNINL